MRSLDASRCYNLCKCQYTTPYKRDATDIAQKVNYTGNNIKSMTISVEASLGKLRTKYIDILYVHWVSTLFLVAFTE